MICLVIASYAEIRCSVNGYTLKTGVTLYKTSKVIEWREKRYGEGSRVYLEGYDSLE